VRELYVFCEGATEQGFCDKVLRQHLFPGNDGRIHTLDLGGLGTGKPYVRVRKFILNTIKKRPLPGVIFTTLFDLYGLPADFPGKNSYKRNAANPTAYVVALEEAFGTDINYRRFVPYLQLHEFETMLLSDPDGFRIESNASDKQIQQLARMAASAPSNTSTMASILRRQNGSSRSFLITRAARH
jgi:hypothetical protein